MVIGVFNCWILVVEWRYNGLSIIVDIKNEERSRIGILLVLGRFGDFRKCLVKEKMIEFYEKEILYGNG